MERISPPSARRAWLYDAMLVVVLLGAAFLRLLGSDWGELQHQHPDELFFTSVTYDIAPVHSLREYFDTASSTLNPHNRGYGFYVYGTLPLFLVRYLYDWMGQGVNVKLFGRQMAAAIDISTVLMLYLIVRRLYGPKTALLASAFSALAVMQIQQAHFYTTDSFVLFFMTLTLYAGVQIATGEWEEAPLTGEPSPGDGAAQTHAQPLPGALKRLLRNPLTWHSLFFGLALGMAAASKINAVVMAGLLPAALAVRYFRRADRDPRLHTFEDFLRRTFVFMVIGALAAFFAFRIFQPYAFTGPGFFDVKLNPAWLKNLEELRAQASGEADMPWNLQWARRSHLYSFQNLTIWGLGLPLGILAWAGFLWMGWQILKGEWSQHVLLWAWTALYFAWQSLQFNATMRYQLPIYPLLCMMAAWLVFRLWDQPPPSVLRRLTSVLVGSLVFSLTAAWAFAFASIYTRAEPRMAASRWLYQHVPGPINVHIQTAGGETYQQPLPFPRETLIRPDAPYETTFLAQADGALTEILLPHAVDYSGAGEQTLTATIIAAPTNAPDAPRAQGSLRASFAPQHDARGEAFSLPLTPPLELVKGQLYTLRLEISGGALGLSGATFANETDYDYGLPFPVPGYAPFDGIYRGDLNLQVYWDDNADKLTRFIETLNQSDFILIPTNHQYAQITRLPERYPLTTVYYRELIGCPAGKDIIWCYRVARPGMFHGRLGFDLVATFENYPRLGALVINDQSAEEAFTFYDHPKVLIFQKRPDYDAAQVQAVLASVDLSQAVHILPKEFNRYRPPKSLLLPEERLEVQQTGGTWSALFNYQWWQNRYPWLGLVLWYGLIFLVGLVTYPLLRRALPGLQDGGYPLARIAGLLIWAWLAWLAGSTGIPYSRLTIGLTLALLAAAGVILGYGQRAELKQEWREKRRYFLLVEALFLLFFLLDLLIRLGNPDLWDPAHGGERPMEFAYFNAILRSTTFPPYDPWYAGGYINYYYYGYVIVGTPVKLLGIVPSIAFNFILPTLFACLALGAFSVGWNLLAHSSPSAGKGGWGTLLEQRALLGGLAAVTALLLVGNLGIGRMVLRGMMCLGADAADQHNCALNPSIHAPQAGLLKRLFWLPKGFFKALSGASLGFGSGEWYYTPSRVISTSETNGITEFPLFTFIHSDLHAHMMSLPLTVLALAWAISTLLAFQDWERLRRSWYLALPFGALVIGALKPTNTWDFYPYLALGCLAAGYSLWRGLEQRPLPPLLPAWLSRLGLAAGGAALLAGLAVILYQPFHYWFGQAYTSLDRWHEYTTQTSEYFTHWGLFLFVILSWMVWETRQWMAQTPLSALRKLSPYRSLIRLAVLVVLIATLALLLMKVWIAWLVLPTAAWAGVLLLRPAQSWPKRGVLFLIGTALCITLFVELFVLHGDIGRMNTLFKFYLEAWVMLSLSAAAAFVWLLDAIPHWRFGWRIAWPAVLALLFTCAVMYLPLGSVDRIKFRWNPDAPHTLDAMNYMQFVQRDEFGKMMDLVQDYRAIRWLQENVQGSPVIVEAAPAGIQYAWFSRISIYTGLPTVIGWEWHQLQQRMYSQEVIARGGEVNNFYATTDVQQALQFLHKYRARYIVVGQLERAKHAGEGLTKFETYDGIYWRAVYRDGETVIYEVIP